VSNFINGTAKNEAAASQ